MTASYRDRLATMIRARGRLCAGIDPHPRLLDQWGLSRDLAGLESCARGMVEALGNVVGVFKPQSAFFEAFGSGGIAVLERTLADVAAAGALSILDVKRGDLGSTMDAYAAAYLTDGSALAADAITLSPYLGFGSLAGAIEVAAQQGRGVYVLALTSNPEGPQIQHAQAVNGRLVGQLIVDEAASVNASMGLGHVGIVVGATIGDVGIDFADLGGSILSPGFGAQGATAADLARVFGSAAEAVVPSMSRELMVAGPEPDRLRTTAARLLGEMSAAAAVR